MHSSITSENLATDFTIVGNGKKTTPSLMSDATKYIVAAFRIAFVILNNLYCFPAYFGWVLLILPLKALNQKWFYTIEGKLQHWLQSMVALWTWTAGYDIFESGDDIEPCFGKKTLVMVNHQSTGDVPLLMSTFNTKGNVLPSNMWIMDLLFKYTNFGAVSMVHGDFFISSGKDNRNDSIKLFKEHLLNSYIPRERNWMVLFPEGGFLRKRRVNSQKFAEKNNLPILHHVTLPRLGALYAIRDTLMAPNENSNNNNNNNVDPLNNKDSSELKQPYHNGHSNGNEANLIKKLPATKLEYILDVTMAYPEGKPLDLQTVVHGMRPPCETHLFYRLYPCSEIPTDDLGLKNWIYDRYVEKEALLDSFYKTKSFISSSNGDVMKSKVLNGHKRRIQPTMVQQNVWIIFLKHLFFIGSTYLFYFQLIGILYNYLMGRIFD